MAMDRMQPAVRMMEEMRSRREPTRHEMHIGMCIVPAVSDWASKYGARLLVDGHGQDAASGEDDGGDEVQAGAHPSRDAHRNVHCACCFGLGK